MVTGDVAAAADARWMTLSAGGWLVRAVIMTVRLVLLCAALASAVASEQGKKPAMDRKSYKARLTHLGLDSLHCRRTKADLLMCYKIINNYTCTQVGFFFTFSSTNQTRGNSRKLDKSHIISHLLAMVIAFPNVLLMCGIPCLTILFVNNCHHFQIQK